LFILDQNSRKTLKVVALLWLAFVLLCLGLGAYLSARVSRVEAQRFPTLAQPCWSEREDQVAYLAREPEASAWQLWKVDRVPSMICQLDPGEWTLLGWLDDDKRLLLQPRSQDVPKVTVVEVASGKQKEIRFENQGIELVGVRGGQMFFQRYDKPDASNQDNLSRSVSLLNWSPGDDKISKVVTIPFDTEKLHIEKVWPSLDHNWFAMVIRMGEGESDRTLWFYNKEEDLLTWSGIRLQCKAIRAAWSPDSSGLVAAIQTDESCDLYAFWDIRSNQYTRLSSGHDSHAYQPFWPREARYFLLLENKRVYKFEPDILQATQLTAQGWDRPKSRDLAVSPRGTGAAYVGLEADDDQLYKVDFKGEYTEPMLPLHPKTAQQKEWWFVAGNAFRTAFQTWTLR
jgi:hypothetical protein